MSLRTSALLGAALALLPCSALGGEAPTPPIELRLGFVAYEDSASQVAGYRKLFLSGEGQRFRARVVPGTYAEVLNWLDRGLLDIAVLTPALYAETLRDPESGALRKHPHLRYLATEGSLPDPESKDTDPYRGRAVCLVRKGSPLRSFARLKEAAQKDRVRFLLVDRLSASGNLAQRHALLQGADLALDEGQIEYTFSHTMSLKRLAEGKEGNQELVAFVFAGAGTAEQRAQFEPVRDFPGLDGEEYVIPQNVWVTRVGFEHRRDLQRLLSDSRNWVAGRRYSCTREEVDRPLYDRVGTWADDLGVFADKPAGLDEIHWLLRHYNQVHTKDGARLAVVLSGGGAKCAYQVGALEVIERKLGDDISLVVGTSGGALNAVPVALGVTKDEPEKLAGEWEQLDLGALARPSALVCALLAVWIACLLVLLLEALRLGVRGWRRAWWHRLWALPLLLVAGAPLLACFLLPWVSAEWIDRRPWLRYPQILLDFGFGHWTAGLLTGLWLAVRFGRARAWIPTSAAAPWGLAAAVVLLPGITLAAQLLLMETLFEGTGMRRVVAARYAELTREALKDSPPAAGDDDQKLTALSAAIVEKIAAGGPGRRDLVITGSCLPPRPSGLDSDLYFYLPAGQGRPAPSFGSRGVALADHPRNLLEVVMGSGTLYPAFPAATVTDFPRPGQSVELIDGGFAHNSPVEAAVQWGATHILLVEASPKSEKEQHKERRRGAGAARHNLVHNVADAVKHLYDQAQLLDARSRGKVVIFTLRPREGHLSVIDFSRGLIRDAVELGKKDAAGANFQRQYGEPRFIEAQETAP